MYSGKIAVPPGGGGIVKKAENSTRNTFFSHPFLSFDVPDRVSYYFCDHKKYSNSVCTPAKLPCRRVEVGYE
jgi:hypothetical protein